MEAIKRSTKFSKPEPKLKRALIKSSLPSVEAKMWRDPIRKARDLSVGDFFKLQVCGEVLTVAPVANGKRIKIKFALEDQGQLEFTDTSLVLEFLCRPCREFHVYEWDDDDDDDRNDVEVDPILSPEGGRVE